VLSTEYSFIYFPLHVCFPRPAPSLNGISGGLAEVTDQVKVKTALSGLFDTDARRHIVSLPLTEFTPSSQEALHTKQA
jgi:hypothetical protein